MAKLMMREGKSKVRMRSGNEVVDMVKLMVREGKGWVKVRR
jgi:hypothetical protein